MACVPNSDQLGHPSSLISVFPVCLKVSWVLSYPETAQNRQMAKLIACQIVSVKPVLRGHSKIDKTKVLKTNDSLMKIESIAECSLGAFCNPFDLH